MLISDCHTDFVTAYDIVKTSEYLSELKKHSIITLAVFTDDIINFKINSIIKLIEFYRKKFNQIFLPVSIENCSNLTFSQVRQLNAFSVTLTWNYNTKYAGGAFDNGDLTETGINAVKCFESDNILIDTAHLNKKSFYHLSDIYEIKFNSHSCISELNIHDRNLENEQIKIIVQNKGILGLALVNKFLPNNKNSDIQNIADTIDYFVDKYGYQYLAIGSDFGGSLDLPINLTKYNNFNDLINIFIKRGYSDEIINSVLHKNYFNFLKNNNILQVN